MDSAIPCTPVPLAREGGNSSKSGASFLHTASLRQFTCSKRCIGYVWLHWMAGGLVSGDEAGSLWRARGLAAKRRLRRTALEELGSAMFLWKRGQRHTRVTALEGNTVSNSVSLQIMHDSRDLQKCVIRSFPGHLEKTTGGYWEKWVHLRYHLLSVCLEKSQCKVHNICLIHSRSQYIETICASSAEDKEGAHILSQK